MSYLNDWKLACSIQGENELVDITLANKMDVFILWL